MRRKIMLGAMAVALPVATLAITLGSTAAYAKKAKPNPDPPRNCSIAPGAVVTFAAPGLSTTGAVSSSKTSVTNTNTVSFSNCSGSVGAQHITTKNTKCGKTAGTPASNTACAGVKKTYGYGSFANFTSAGASSVAKSLKKLNFTIDGSAYQTKTTSATATTCGSEVGFAITGSVKKPKQDKGQTAHLTVCLGADTGPGTSGTFSGDFGHPGLTIATASIDPATSKVTIG